MIHFKRQSPAFFLFAIILFLSYPSTLLAQTCTDVDGDGYGLNGDASCPAPGVDCDDDDPNVYPDAPRICDAKDSDCDGFDDFFTDKDQDGDGSTLCTHWQTGLKDCDDSNPVMYPGNVEGPFGDPTCSDGFDNDCDYRKDGSDNGCSVNCVDSDGDGYGNPGNVTCPNGNALDCNDSNDLINPGATDTNCNGVDDNCSGTADDGYVPTGTNCGTGECASTGTLSCSGGVESDSCVEGLPAKEGALGHPTCSDTLDNDCDGATDGTDAGCQSSCLDDDGDGYGHYGDASCTNSGVDCDDDNAAINPGATDDVCDGVDANCSGTADDEYTPPVTNCGIGQCFTNGLLVCIAGVPQDNCVPLNPLTEGPFGDPTCNNGIDDDCDGVVDAPDNDCNPLDQDNDGDGFCEIGPCQNPSNLGGDCDDTDSVTYPGAARICDAVDNDCDGFQDYFTDVDGDGDGVPMCGGDCDDNNSLRSPLLIEGPWGDATCADFIDNDCDNRTDGVDVGCGADCLDTDGDGYGNPGNPSCPNGGALDCDNFNALINPGATDTNCNAVDDNCTGTADDGYVVTGTNCGVGECASTGNLTCSGGVENNSCSPGTPVVEGPLGDATCGDTLDNDCDGATDGSDTGCQFSCLDDDGDGYGLNGDASCTNAGVDCDDNNININPGATDDVCDGVDANCSGTPDDEYTPTGTNCGTGECATIGLMICNAGVPEDDCTPLAPGTEGPFGDPTCSDTLDNDCDTEVDAVDNDCNPLDIDNDLDGYCEGPTCSDGRTPGDCDDTNIDVYPGAARVCDGKDNDCDGFQDFFTDKDTDGDGTTLCVHYQTGLQDCDDNNPNRFPGNNEGFGDPSCDDGIDNDCDYKIDLADVGCLDQCNDGDGDGYGNPGHASCANPEQDCDNTNDLIHPGATDDTCDGVDDNCSGTADDEYVPSATNCGIGECARTGTLTCIGGIETDDCTAGLPVKEGALGHATCSDTFDNDCDGTTDGADIGCQSSCLDDDGDGYGYYGNASCPNAGVDCNDDNAAINPGATDNICDGVDANCSGTPDDEYVPSGTNCGVGECVTTGQLVCNGGAIEDNCIPLPAGVEDYLTPLVCTDTLDNDCDGDTDTFDVGCNPPDIDNDGDGYCEGPTCSDASTPGDCDDTDDTVHPGGNTTVCDGKDTNCDTWDDFFSDVDNDGDGVPLCNADCNDSDPDRYPGNQEGPFGDATCFDGIDNDCNNKTDEADSQCAPPTCTTKTNPTGGPHMFDLLDGGNNVLKTPCQWCHFTDYQGTILDERVNCQRCHAPASDTSDPLNGILKEQVSGPVNGNPAPTAYPADPPYGFATAVNVKLHSSTVLGTKYGAWNMDCLTCHNPHLQEQDARYGSSYGKLIKEKICFDNTAIGGGNFEEIIEFTAASGPGSFADAPPKNANICEMCHTLTNHHRRDDVPEGPGGPSHSDSKNCTNCHRHSDGFAPNVIPAWHHDSQPFLDNCDYCHVTPTDFITPVPDSKCNQCHTPDGVLKLQFPQEFSGAIDVLAHTDANGSGKYVYTNACIDCHEPMFDEATNLKLIRFTILKSVLPGSNIEFSAYSGPGSFADGPPHENNICETCHTLTNHHQADGTAPGGQSHNFEATCTNCHTHSLGFLPGAEGQSHDTHLKGEKGPNLDCETGCHGTNIPPLFDDGLDLTNTAVCNNCHSPGGVIDGVNDSLTGAKANWPDGIYNGRELKTGKEQWCAGCHDDAPSNSKIDGTGVSAPNIAGDGLTFGFYINGHGRNGQVDCVQCHDANARHIDHKFASVLDIATTRYAMNTVINFTEYRFYNGKRIHSLYGGDLQGENYQLCYSCHDESWYTDTTTLGPDLETNFRKDDYIHIYSGISANGNLHQAHIRFDGGTTCMQCHDVHGVTKDASDTVVPGFTRMTTTWAGSYVNLTLNPGDNLYYELTDPNTWNDPLFNVGGASTSAAPCGPCHGYADLTNGVGPNEPNDYFGGPWYLRLYKPHTYAVNFDIDNDGLTDNLDNCPDVSNVDQTDSDIDFIGDDCDTCPGDPINDVDYDGICGDTDICPYDQYDDFDSDGICGDKDNCSITANSLQADIDGDGFGDACDNCINIQNPDQANVDFDMLGDDCDTTCSSYIQLSWNTIRASEHDIGKDVVMGPGGSLYLGGETDGDIAGQIGSWDFVLIKYDASGTEMWTRQFGTLDIDVMLDIDVDSGGNAYIAGQKLVAGGGNNMIIYKYDSDGNESWVKELGGYAHAIAVDSSSNVYVTSHYGHSDIGVVKFDTDGVELWRNHISSSMDDTAWGIDADTAGNVYVTGWTKGDFAGTNSGGADMVVVKFNTDGVHQWSAQFGTPENDYARGIAVDSSGNSYVTGGTYGNFAAINNGAQAFVTFKLDPSGNLLWSRQFNALNPFTDGGESITLETSGNVYVTGGDIYIISYDSDGNQRFASHFEHADLTRGYGIAADGGGNAFITGRFSEVVNNRGQYDLFLLKAGGQCQQP